MRSVRSRGKMRPTQYVELCKIQMMVNTKIKPLGKSQFDINA